MPRSISSRFGPAVIRLGLMACLVATATAALAEDAEFVAPPAPVAAPTAKPEPSTALKPSQGVADTIAPKPEAGTSFAPAQGADEFKDEAAPKSTATATDPVVKPKPATEGGSADQPKQPAVAAPDAREPPPVAAARPAEPESLRVLSWGGAYGEAQKRGVFKTLPEDFEAPVKRIERSGSGDRGPDADVVEVDQLVLEKGCASGRFLKLRDIALAPGGNGEAPADDFIAGGLTPCGVATFAWSALFVVDDDGFKRRKPSRLADVFDTRRFPGKRVFIESTPEVVLLTALAAGIPAEKVRDALLTQEGADAVFGKLEGLREHIIWARNSKESLELLADKQATFAMSFSGRLFRKMIAGQVRPIRDAHVYEFASWAVRADTKRPDEAKAFIVAATEPRRLAAQARFFPYGPMRRSAVRLVGRHALVDVELEPYLPTAPERLKTSFQLDGAYWAQNRPYFDARLKAFVDGLKDGVRIPPPVQTPKELRKQTELPTRKPVDG